MIKTEHYFKILYHIMNIITVDVEVTQPVRIQLETQVISAKS